ncbi:hypothetical protein CMUS01_15381 [Colletotrichum musicola]|uniref:Uncharacterized protein n=1 Tax=Colletotrichum musicola TaxID=2175873 RepID=A0A8H6MMK8_9PEZI|nr:hypothetical protein CMUS01_15381 [Colletotrichum musicola]
MKLTIETNAAPEDGRLESHEQARSPIPDRHRQIYDSLLISDPLGLRQLLAAPILTSSDVSSKVLAWADEAFAVRRSTARHLLSSKPESPGSNQRRESCCRVAMFEDIEGKSSGYYKGHSRDEFVSMSPWHMLEGIRTPYETGCRAYLAERASRDQMSPRFVLTLAVPRLFVPTMHRHWQGILFVYSSWCLHYRVDTVDAEVTAESVES